MCLLRGSLGIGQTRLLAISVMISNAGDPIAGILDPALEYA